MSIFNEESYENAVLYLLENLGYEHIYGPDVERDYRVPFYEAQLAHSLMLVNPNKPAVAIEEAIRREHSSRRTKSSWTSSRMA